ncbi:Lem3/Cdc50 [Ascodesmis nigricans]|uniref:Lem3/Cdc50 n=1 Tax=Ascodesmis nigricans TaxID=341454 RepID=A0A4S2N5K4_9PEZI|nr:Lem3/Cdc50 [Ascodesmis nigricans]
MPSSIDEDRDDNVRNRKKEKSRKPGNTAFRQQRLKAWQPILTPKTVLPLFFIVGCIFAPIGGLLLWSSAKVQEIVIDYTECDRAKGGKVDIPSGKFKTAFHSAVDPGAAPPQWEWITGADSALPYAPKYKENVCRIEFQLPNELKAPVLLYYRLTNFYQNHRRYVQSLDEDQLRGKPRTYSSIDGSGNCDPLVGEQGKPYYPCGLIANSIFNDTFGDLRLLNAQENRDNVLYSMTNKGIAWETDKERYGTTEYKPEDVLPPPNWVESYPGGYTNESMPKLRENEEFQVWMRTAGLPTFSKLAKRNDKDTMQKGRYRIEIYSRFPVKKYSGTKSIVISTRTVMGGRNPFLGIAYVVVGGLCVVLGALFTARHLIKPRKLGDHTYLSWNNEDSGHSGVAAGRDGGLAGRSDTL